MVKREVDPGQLLASHTIFRCHDIATFHAYIAGMEGGHKRRVEGDGPVEIELRHAPLGPLDVGLAYASAPMLVEAERDPSKPFYVQYPFSGSVRIELDGKSFLVGPDRGLVISPSSHARRESDPGWTLSIGLDAALVRLRLAALLGHAPTAPLLFAPVVSAAAIRDYCLLLAHAVDLELVTAGREVAEAMANGLVDLLLDLQPHSYSEVVRDARATAKSTRIKVVAEYLEGHLDEPLRIGTLAGVAGCSIRSLQSTFLEHCGCTPMEFVKRRRLARARQLLESGHRDTTVTQAALAAGFSHLGKFSQSYQEFYGERPSETLRRTTRRGTVTTP